MTYRITVSIAYEGESSFYCDSLVEVRETVKRGNWSWDDIEVMESPKYIDVYELMKDGS